VVALVLLSSALGCTSTDATDESAPPSSGPAEVAASADNGGPSGSEGDHPGDDPYGTIVVEHGIGPDERLAAVHLGTGEVQLITDAPAFGPRLSPDGGQVAATRVEGSQGEVWLVGTDGTDRGPVTSGACPAWTTRGLLVATGDGAIDLVSLDGSVLTRRLGSGTENRCAVEAPGGLVVFAQTDRIELHRDGDVEELVTMAGCGLGTVGVRGDQPTIAFAAACDDDRSGLYVMDLDAEQPRQVLATETYGAAWSPDGGWLATARLDRDSGEYELVVLRADGSDVRVIETPGPVNNPTWGPSRVAAGGSSETAAGIDP
jgi:hypothetical protein